VKCFECICIAKLVRSTNDNIKVKTKMRKTYKSGGAGVKKTAFMPGGGARIGGGNTLPQNL